MIAQYKERAGVDELCQWAGVSKSSSYYKAHPGQRGMKASTHTPWGETMVPNEQVAEQIRMILGQEYCVYGYQMMTLELRSMGYYINAKKVYRLMDTYRLLCGKVIRTQGKRRWRKFRRIRAIRPMEYLCLDIKYVWVHGENRWYYQLAIMDVYSRRILCWIFQSSVKQKDVIGLMRWLDLRYNFKGVFIRNDNGSQFLANKVRQTLQDLEAVQEFTHVATPEENAYIEAFHSIQQRELMDRHTFLGYYDAKRHIENYMRWYNCKRKHGSLNGLTPMEKWIQGFACSPLRQPIEPGSTNWSRPDEAGDMSAGSALYSLDQLGESAYLRLGGGHQNTTSVANLSKKTVQLIGV